MQIYVWDGDFQYKSRVDTVLLQCLNLNRSTIFHYSDVIINAIAPQLTGVSMVYSIVCSGADQRKYQSSASLTFVRGIHRWPVNSPHKWPVTRKMFPFYDVILRSVKYMSVGSEPSFNQCYIITVDKSNKNSIVRKHIEYVYCSTFFKQMMPWSINSLRPSDAIWRRRSGPTSA